MTVKRYVLAASVYDKYSVGPSILPICTRYFSTMINAIQVCGYLHSARAWVINTHRDEIERVGAWSTHLSGVTTGEKRPPPEDHHEALGAILCADPNRRIRNWKVNH